MGYASVDVYVKDTTAQALPVTGVNVSVFSQDGTLFFTQSQTDANGHVGFSLPDTTTFQLRFYKFQVSFTNPQYITVAPTPGPNVFNISAQLVPPPVSRDPRICVAFGHFRNGDGSPQAGLILHFIPKFKPLLIDGNAIMPEHVYEHTDKKGYLEVNLFRCGQYDVTVTGLEDVQRMISVPDQPNINLPDLLFPVVSLITFTPAPPFVIPVGQTLQVKPNVFTSDGNYDKGGWNDVTWSSSNPAVLGLTIAGGMLNLLGVSHGSATINAIRNSRDIVRIPNTPIVGVPQAVSVQ